MIVVHGTRAFRDRVPGPQAGAGEVSTTLLGVWYATPLRWRRPAALLVDEQTLLPLITPLAPAATLLSRLPDVLAELLEAHRVTDPLIRTERMHASQQRLAPTANRSVVGVLTQLAFLADHHRADQIGLLGLSLRLAKTPCSPLHQRNTSPDRELAALIAAQPTEGTPGPHPDVATRCPQRDPLMGMLWAVNQDVGGRQVTATPKPSAASETGPAG